MLKSVTHIVEKNSQRLGCKSICRLMVFDQKKPLMEQRKKLRELLLLELEKQTPESLDTLETSDTPKPLKHLETSDTPKPLNTMEQIEPIRVKPTSVVASSLLKNDKQRSSDQKNLLSMEQKKILLTPGIPPKTPVASISLSHCDFMGGFIIAPFPHGIGFDLEQWGRAKEKTVLRIANKEELNFAPSPSALWSAKESAYKSLSQYTKSKEFSIKQIFVFNWRPLPYQETSKNLLEIYDYKFKVIQKKQTGSSTTKSPRHLASYKTKEISPINGTGYVCCFKLKGLKINPVSNKSILKKKPRGSVKSDPYNPYNNKVIAFALLS